MLDRTYGRIALGRARIALDAFVSNTAESASGAASQPQ